MSGGYIDRTRARKKGGRQFSTVVTIQAKKKAKNKNNMQIKAASFPEAAVISYHVLMAKNSKNILSQFRRPEIGIKVSAGIHTFPLQRLQDILFLASSSFW